MYMVGHDRIAEKPVPFGIRDMHPLIYQIIRFSDRDQVQPAKAGEGPEVDRTFLCPKLSDGHVREGSMEVCRPQGPEVGDPAEG
jgi:hypothetical protein